jgi:hypothetical protein
MPAVAAWPAAPEGPPRTSQPSPERPQGSPQDAGVYELLRTTIGEPQEAASPHRASRAKGGQ